MTSIVTVEAHTAKPGGVVRVQAFDPLARATAMVDQTYIIENGAKHTFYVSGEQSLSVVEGQTIVIHAPGTADPKVP